MSRKQSGSVSWVTVLSMGCSAWPVLSMPTCSAKWRPTSEALHAQGFLPYRRTKSEEVRKLNTSFPQGLPVQREANAQ